MMTPRQAVFNFNFNFRYSQNHVLRIECRFNCSNHNKKQNQHSITHIVGLPIERRGLYMKGLDRGDASVCVSPYLYTILVVVIKCLIH